MSGSQPQAPCCDLHQEVGCCDTNDCGPCCENCPTCPTLARHRRAAEAPRLFHGEPVQLTQIRQWEAGELYPEHDTFSFGRGFGTAITRAFDALMVDGFLVREVLEAVCRRDGISLMSDVEPDQPARNYELALRLGIGPVFGINDG